MWHGWPTVSLIASLVLLALAVSPLPASAWNIPGHMLSAAITYQILLQENPSTIEKVKAVLEKHPWYANQWQARIQDVPGADRDRATSQWENNCSVGGEESKPPTNKDLSETALV
jgi:hypothetical protein